jgi:lysine-N-methylase
LRKAKLKEINKNQIPELLGLLRSASDAETPASPMMLPRPGWTGRILFRQAAALFARMDRGPLRGPATRNALARIGAAWNFTRGRGPVPRLHAALPEATFEDAEIARGPLPPAADEVLERYFLVKVASTQFCGVGSFRLPLEEGFEALAVTLPIILWLARLWRDIPREEAITRALTLVDYHIGFNRALARFRQRLSFTILSRSGDLERLIAWYSR